ncbi:hypothetical protein E2C01_043187 [Portunus trituberculatus]|uniref:Uncharacterized protein n=1 Tax=Portunus trituberculatus TaxID=210409 RepID=A0A5B7FWU8_PORTR|nr:hypothetical protein [Portunus trituberculatus]
MKNGEAHETQLDVFFIRIAYHRAEDCSLLSRCHHNFQHLRLHYHEASHTIHFADGDGDGDGDA